MARRIKPSAVKNEGDITANNILQLNVNPVQGEFDAEHLKEINRRVLDGIPSYDGGKYRINKGEHVRSRSVNEGNDVYVVHYKEGGVTDKDINDAIKKLGSIENLKSLDTDKFAEKMTTLYADLDHIHPFTEANSRSLRVFTEQIADAAGRSLNWPQTNVNQNVRDELYKARDLEVSKRSFPDLTIDKMRDANMSQIEAYETQKLLKDTKPLGSIMKENIDRPMNLTFANENAYQDKLIGAANPYAKGKSQVAPAKAPQQTNQNNNIKTATKASSRGVTKGKR